MAMSLLFHRQRLLSTGHHGNFPGNGARAKTRKLGKMGKGPHGPPEGLRGARRYPYGSVPNRCFFPRTVASSPQTSTPNRTCQLFSENPNSTFDDFRQFPSEIRHFRNSPRNSRLIRGVSPGPYGPIWVGSDNRGYQKRPPRPISIFPVFPFFRAPPIQPAPGRSPTQKFPWWAGCA